MAQSKRCKEITDLRRIIRDETAPGLARLNAATKLIENHGATERNSATIRKRVKALLLSPDPVIADRAADVRDLLVRRLETKPATKILKSLMDPNPDDDDEYERSRPSRVYPRRLVIKEPADDEYSVGNCPLQPFLDRLRAFKLKATRTDRTQEVRAAFGLNDSEAIDIAMLKTMFLSCMHEHWSDDVSGLLTAIIGHANHERIGLPRPSIPLLQELTRRD